MKKKADKKSIVSKVVAVLKKHAMSAGLASDIMVDEHAVREDGEWWYVTVYPKVQAVDKYRYYDVLSNAEEELQEKLKLDVLLVPVRPTGKARK